MQGVHGASGLHVSLLGELTAAVDGVALDLGGPRQRAVLALLVLARGQAVPAERLADSLWGEDAPGSVAGALQSYVSHLRRRLEPGSAARTRSRVITREGPGYAVRLPETAVDAWQFEALLERARAATDPPAVTALLGSALALWRGPALADYADAGWAQPEIARLTDLRAVAREQLLGARLAGGEAALLVPELELLVAEEPLREQRWRLLVLALYRAQRQADALAALRRARATLADELGVDPGPALRELEAEVLAQSPALDIPAQRAAAPPPVAAAAALAAIREDDLVDRDAELAALQRAVGGLVAGRPGLVLVDGPAGIGKTRLLAELRRMGSDRGCRVLSARGSQLERDFGFGVVRQLFEPVVAEHAGHPSLLEGPAASARGVFDLAESEKVDGSFAALHGLYWLTADLSSAAPLVLVVDDLQWCDTASLRFLGYLARRLDGLQVLVVGSARSGEPRDDELLAELTLDPAVVCLRPAPLSAPASAGLVRSRLGNDAAPVFVEACHRTTSGNPLLLRQLLRALETDGVRPDAAHAHAVLAVGSRAVSSMVLLRLRRMPSEATAVARAVAVLGDGAQLPAVATLAGLTEQDAVAALTSLIRNEVLRDEQPLGFVHPLVGDAVYRDLPVAERELEHERAAAVRLSARAPAEQVAAHLLLAARRGSPTTVAVLRAAARTAGARGAAESAVTYLRRALEEPPEEAQHLDVLLELGLFETLLDGPASAHHLTQAYELLEDPATRGEIAIVIARTHVFTSPPEVASRFAREARLSLPGTLADAQQGLLAIERSSAFMQSLDPAVWQAQPLPEPVGRGHGALMLSAALAWETLLAGRDRERAVELARRALHRDRLWQVDNGLLWVIAAICRSVADDDLGDFWHRARAEAHARGSLFAAMSTNLWEGFWRSRRGELPEALSCVTLAEEQTAMWGGTAVGVSYARASSLAIHLDRGDLAAARQVADATGQEHLVGEGGRLFRHAVVRLLVEERRCTDALAVLAATDPAPHVVNPAWNPWRSLRAAALHGLGRTDEAVALVTRELDLLRRWGAPSSVGLALTTLGRLHGAAGVEHLREAVAVLEPTPAALLLARAQLALATAPGVGGAEARRLLCSAFDGAHACGAPGVRDDAGRALARRGGERPVPSSGPVLSTTERRILVLAAGGSGVRDIARALFLTPGTVQAVLDAAGDGPVQPGISSASQVPAATIAVPSVRRAVP